MADRYLLEDGSGYYLLEDGSGYVCLTFHLGALPMFGRAEVSDRDK